MRTVILKIHYICPKSPHLRGDWVTLNYLKKLCLNNITKQKLIFNDSSDFIF